MSNDIFKNLKTLDQKKDVCDNENRCKLSLNNIVKAVKTDWKKYEADLKYQQVYNKIAGKHVPPTLEEDYILNTRNNTIPFAPKKPFPYGHSG